jgi:hypothetical protein
MPTAMVKWFIFIFLDSNFTVPKSLALIFFFHFSPVRRNPQKSSRRKLVNFMFVHRKIHCRRPKPSPTNDPSSHRPDRSFGASGLPRTEKRESTLIFNFVSTVASGPRGVAPIILCFDGDSSAT